MKRGSSGLSLLVAVNKPQGMSSHDVVNRVRRIFGERRVGHTGTLDPAATGVLPLCVGPATRLDQYLTGHDKRYRVSIAFGNETTTDDAEGQPTVFGEVPPHLRDRSYASDFIASLVGVHQQLPPAYSAIKVGGVKAYEAARSGQELELEFREIRVLDARLLSVDGDADTLSWTCEFKVSKGTYIRSLARDIGRVVGCPAHVRSLHRNASGNIDETQAVSLETLEALKEQAALDPVDVLGLRYAFADEVERFVCAGNALREDQVRLNEPIQEGARSACACMGRVVESVRPPEDGELACVVVRNRLKALYAYDAGKRLWKPACVFSTSIFRG